jgi:hypothetical protein
LSQSAIRRAGIKRRAPIGNPAGSGKFGKTAPSPLGVASRFSRAARRLTHPDFGVSLFDYNFLIRKSMEIPGLRQAVRAGGKDKAA